MRSFVLPSTFLLTLVLMVGLFFFIRASVKDRTEELQWLSPQTEEAVLKKVEDYLTKRSYRLTALDKELDQVTFEGTVRPSVVLACFLTALMLTATLCLSLVFSILFPTVGLGFTVITVFSPVAGWFYWKRAQRPEQVRLKVESVASPADTNTQTLLTVTAHRDEITAMRPTLKTFGVIAS
ncbi:cofactor assembly of complex C subunit B [Acaryochloris sp. IP29b_bin.137]|uniref:cofactor assembly of complex C subunit B n=1 Tax=Acaryochloris sp. IP29b_bin.137 TaxID=2969217 RepID=UPI003450AE1A